MLCDEDDSILPGDIQLFSRISDPLRRTALVKNCPCGLGQVVGTTKAGGCSTDAACVAPSEAERPAAAPFRTGQRSGRTQRTPSTRTEHGCRGLGVPSLKVLSHRSCASSRLPTRAMDGGTRVSPCVAHASPKSSCSVAARSTCRSRCRAPETPTKKSPSCRCLQTRSSAARPSHVFSPPPPRRAAVTLVPTTGCCYSSYYSSSSYSSYSSYYYCHYDSCYSCYYDYYGCYRSYYSYYSYYPYYPYYCFTLASHGSLKPIVGSPYCRSRSRHSGSSGGAVDSAAPRAIASLFASPMRRKVSETRCAVTAGTQCLVRSAPLPSKTRAEPTGRGSSTGALNSPSPKTSISRPKRMRCSQGRGRAWGQGTPRGRRVCAACGLRVGCLCNARASPVLPCAARAARACSERSERVTKGRAKSRWSICGGMQSPRSYTLTMHESGRSAAATTPRASRRATTSSSSGGSAHLVRG